jgi:hypothetical protein
MQETREMDDTADSADAAIERCARALALLPDDSRDALRELVAATRAGAPHMGDVRAVIGAHADELTLDAARRVVCEMDEARNGEPRRKPKVCEACNGVLRWDRYTAPECRGHVTGCSEDRDPQTTEWIAELREHIGKAQADVDRLTRELADVTEQRDQARKMALSAGKDRADLWEERDRLREEVDRLRVDPGGDDGE